MKSLKLVGAFSDKDLANQIAQQNEAILLTASSDRTDHLPFAALVIGVTDDIEDFISHCDVGAYLVCERTIKNLPLTQLDAQSSPGSVGIFSMVANPEMGARESDQHWRDQHAPLALSVHVAMTHYYQLSVLQSFKGPAWNGFALCCFNTEDDLRNKFFDTEEGEKAVVRKNNHAFPTLRKVSWFQPVSCRPR